MSDAKDGFDFIAKVLNKISALPRDGIERLIRVFQILDSLADVVGGNGASAPPAAQRMGSPSATGKKRGRPAKHAPAAESSAAAPANGVDSTPVANAEGGKRRRGKFTATADELKEMYKTMKAKDIAEKYGVSAATVSINLKKYGIQKEGRAKSGEKQARTKAGSKKN